MLDLSPVPDGGTPAEALRNSVELAKLADQWGYHRFWVAEHHAVDLNASVAPEIMVGRIAAATERMRVGSGGVLLSLYSPMKVAEVFRTLQALHPDRIDLGIGRSLGALETEAKALAGLAGPLSEAEFQRKLTELLGFLGAGFPDGHPYADIPIMPTVDTTPPVWLLGSSPGSATMAARNKLSYAYAHFIRNAGTRAAFETYQSSFPGGQSILAVGVYCAESEMEARRIGSAGQPPVQDASDGWPRRTIGTPRQVRDELTAMAEALNVDEITVMAYIYDHKARLRSYELLAEIMELA